MSLPNLTKHFKLLVVGVLVTIIILGICRWVLRSGTTSTNGPRVRVTAVLPKDDKEIIAFNEKTHTLTIQTAAKTTTGYAKSPVVEIRKDGEVVVQRHLAGFELAPFLGGGYADTGRLFIGANVFHFSRFDVSGSLSWTPDNRYAAIQPFLALGYNFYNNTSINIGVAPLSLVGSKGVEIGGFVSVRL